MCDDQTHLSSCLLRPRWWDTGRASTVSCSASHQLPVSASKADALNRRRRIEKMTMMKQVSLSDDDAMWCDQRSDRFRAFIYIRCWLMTRLRQGDKDGLQIDDWLVLCCFSPFPFLKRRKKESSQCSVTMWESAEQHLKCFFCITNETREGSSSSSSCFALLKMDRLRGDKKARRVWESHYYFCFYNWKRAIEGECCCSAAAAAGLVVTRTGRRSFVNAALSSQRYQSCKLD